MTKATSFEHPAGSETARREARARRLAAALKANLRKRKAQARGRASETGGPGDAAAAPGGSHDSARIADDKRSG
jgi:hypothetical protein